MNSASNGQIVTVDLPNNSIVDLSSFTMFFTGSTTTTAGSAIFSRNIETIIDRLEVEINGQLISSGCSMINQLYQILYDLQCGTDARNRRCVLQNGNDITAAPTANQTNVPFMIQNWLGFISSAAPNHINTGILGNVRVRDRRASCRERV